jgi:hypothetical protein
LVKDIYNKNNMIQGLSRQLLEDKTLNFLLGQATFGPNQLE